MIEITVIACPQPRQWIEKTISIEHSHELSQMIEILQKDPDWTFLQDKKDWTFSVWGRKVPMSYALSHLDRLEIVRGLLVDPKTARRERFKKQGTRTAGLFSKKRPGAKQGY
ncbi:MAG: RnfH family protein [Limnohabitans sp.]|nr:RnfH family protein [Limnohabitans sp.]